MGKEFKQSSEGQRARVAKHFYAVRFKFWLSRVDVGTAVRRLVFYGIALYMLLCGVFWSAAIIWGSTI